MIITLYSYSIQQQKIHSTNTELENYKKSIVQEQEHNEQLTLLLHKIETDICHIKRYIDQCEIKAEAYKVDYMTYTRALQETEQSLTAVTGVRAHTHTHTNTCTHTHTHTYQQMQRYTTHAYSLMLNTINTIHTLNHIQ